MRSREFKGLLVWLLLSTSVWSQNSFTGTVTDTDSNNIDLAEVYIKELQLLTTTTDSGNFYFDDIPSGSYQVAVFAFGFQVTEATVEVQANTTSSLVLQPLGEALSEVVVTQEREKVRPTMTVSESWTLTVSLLITVTSRIVLAGNRQCRPLLRSPATCLNTKDACVPILCFQLF